MLSKKTWIALALVVVQVIVLVILTRSPKRAAGAAVLPAISAKDVQRIVLTKGSDVVEMERRESAAATPDGGPAPDPEWQMKKPVLYPADKSAVKTLLERLEKMAVSADPISRKKEWHDEKFGVGDKSGWKVELYGRDNNPIASFLLGKSDGGRTFLRKIGEDAVYQATGIMAYAFDEKTHDWRDKTIFDLKDEEIARVEIRGKETVVLARGKDGKEWVLERPTGIKLDRGKAQSVARTFATLRAKEFAEGEKPETTGLSNPVAAVTAHLKDGKTFTLLIGKKKGQYDSYVRRADRDTVFVVGSWQVEQIHRSPADLREKEPIIARPAPSEVQKIVVGPRGSPVTMVRAGEDWKMTAPLEHEADRSAVENLLSQVEKLNVPESTFGGKEKHAEFQLDAKGIRVELFGAGGKRLSAFVIGKEDKGQTYLRKIGDAKVYRAYGLSRSAFEKAPAAWRSKVVLSFRDNDVEAIEIEREGKPVRVARNGKAWKIEKPRAAPADEKKVQDLLSTLSNFWAADFAAQAKPEETGLAQPTLKVSVQLKGKGARTLVVGKQNAKGEYFAKRSDRPQVYLLASWQLPRISKTFEDLAAQDGQKK